MRIWPALLVAMVALAAPASAARWIGPDWIRGDSHAGVPTLAVNARGDALLAWGSSRGVRVAFAHDGGDFARPRLITSPPSYPGPPAVALSDDGAAVVAWWECHDYDSRLDECLEATVRAAMRAPGRAFDAAGKLSGSLVLSQSPSVAVRGNRVVVAWQSEEGLATRRGRPGHGFGRTVTRYGGATTPYVGIGPPGVDSFVFQRRDAVTTGSRQRRGRFGPARTAVRDAAELRSVGFAPDGERAVLWSSPAFHGTHLHATILSPDGHKRSQMVRRRVGTPRYTDTATLATAPDGHSLVTYTRGSDVFARMRRPGRPFGREQRVPGAFPYESGAVNDHGRALVLSPNGCTMNAATGSARGGFDATAGFRTVEVGGRCAGGGTPQVGLDARGRGYAAWGTGADTWYARFRP
ncbi:MAG: hypothetical protein QOG63_3005 [Thermoleophilaceae bacterium]|jgi:hypothetical protein|nr:hypothetical protein [Thermoleophilaceae bacterium]